MYGDSAEKHLAQNQPNLATGENEEIIDYNIYNYAGAKTGKVKDIIASKFN